MKFNEVDSSNQLKLEQLLFGVSFYNRKQLPESLVHFWISTERLIEYLWNRDFKGQKDKITQEIKQKIYEKIILIKRITLNGNGSGQLLIKLIYLKNLDIFQKN